MQVKWYVVVLLSGTDSEAHIFNSHQDAQHFADLLMHFAYTSGWENQYDKEGILVMPCYKGEYH